MNWLCRFATPTLLTLLLAPLAVSAGPPVSGAKELFYDPGSRQVESSSAPGKPAPHPHRSAVPARLDAGGRRLAAVPAVAATPGTGSPSLPVGLSYWLELVGAGGGSGSQVTDRRVFHSGERIRLHFRANADGEIALIQMGTSGTSHVLFPDPRQGLTDTHLRANQDRVLPSGSHWFRFDDHPGSERILVLFAARERDLARFPVAPRMDHRQTAALVASTRAVQGSKDLLIETEATNAAEIGTYGVNLAGDPVVLEIDLEHR